MHKRNVNVDGKHEQELVAESGLLEIAVLLPAW